MKNLTLSALALLVFSVGNRVTGYNLNANNNHAKYPTSQDIFGFPTFEELGKETISHRRLLKPKLKASDLYLPRYLIPLSYDLKIRPILESSDPNEKFSAPGSVKILVRCLYPTDTITLHAHTREFVQIRVETLMVERHSAQESQESKLRTIQIIGHSIPEKEDADFFRIHLGEILEMNEDYVIHMDFLTKISTTTLDGLYLSKYQDPQTSETKYVAVTQFEDIAARQMFPGFDEPDLKASFKVTISRAAKYNSMSNMPLASTEPDPEKEGYFLDHYAPTPPMSTYLLALVVSEFTCSTAPSGLYDKLVQACGPPHLVEKGGAVHAAAVSARLLKFYEDLWNVSYPLPKMQSVAIPNFEAGAMENYGLNTYRVEALLYYPGESSEASRQRIESTVAHELAHQNFGDLVTCKTWNNIFLNEGFATFVSNVGMDEVSPEFEEGRYGWYTGYFQRALKADANPATHPIVKTDDYFGDFDAITYSKGASLIKMMENLLSWPTLTGGLRKYLKTFSFGNVEYSDLYSILDAQANFEGTHPKVDSLNNIMKSWTVKPGFPLIRVEWIYERLFHISQERFLRRYTSQRNNGSQLGLRHDADGEGLWHCPIYIHTSVNIETEKPKTHEKPTFWLTNKESTKAWASKTAIKWLIVNPEAKVFSRVLYDERLSKAIENQLNRNPEIFNSITRAQLIDDAFECAWAGYSSVKLALGRTKFLLQESESRVWSTALGNFQLIYGMLSEHDEGFVNLKKYLVPRITFAINSIGVEQSQEDKGQIVMHRASLLRWGAALQIPQVLEYASRLTYESQENSTLTNIPVDIRSEILCAYVTRGGRKATETVLRLYANTQDSAERSMLIVSLGCTKDPEELNALHEKVLNPNVTHTITDSYTLLQKLVSNSVARLKTFDFIQQNFNDILSYFGQTKALSGILGMFSSYWNTQSHLKLMKGLQQKFHNELKPVEQDVNKIITRIENNIEWMDNHGCVIISWLKEQPECSPK